MKPHALRVGEEIFVMFLSATTIVMGVVIANFQANASATAGSLDPIALMLCVLMTAPIMESALPNEQLPLMAPLLVVPFQRMDQFKQT